jgi:LuxR family transcriptional regulator, quorum-sensing system regulator SolR
VVWNDAMFAKTQKFWEDANAHGIRVGWGMPTRGPGATVGLLSVSRSQEELKLAEIDSIEVKLIYLAQLTHEAMCRCWLPKNVPEALCQLTPREREVLMWTAEGKTTPEASLILGISERTVMFHLYNVMSKLNVHTKPQLVMKAAMLGLLE